MTKYKRLTKNGSKIIYSFETLDGTGTFSIDENDFSVTLLTTKCYLKNKEMDEKTLKKVLYYGAKKIKELNFPENCIYATH